MAEILWYFFAVLPHLRTAVRLTFCLLSLVPTLIRFDYGGNLLSFSQQTMSVTVKTSCHKLSGSIFIPFYPSSGGL
jgi:hypothetical protein